MTSIAALIQSATHTDNAILEMVASQLIKIEGKAFTKSVNELMKLCGQEGSVFSQKAYSGDTTTIHHYGVAADIGKAILFGMHTHRVRRDRFEKAADVLGLSAVQVEEGKLLEDPAAHFPGIRQKAQAVTPDNASELAWALLLLRDGDYEKGLEDVVNVLAWPGRGVLEKTEVKDIPNIMSMEAKKLVIRELIRLGISAERREKYLDIASGRAELREGYPQAEIRADAPATERAKDRR